MSLDWEAWELALLEPGSGRPAIVVRIATDPVIRLWAGAVRDLALPSDLVESEDGAIYQSMGLLTEIPVVDQLLNGEAGRYAFGLSGAGVTAEIADLASSEAPEIRGAIVNIGLMYFDANWGRGTPVLWLAEYEADQLTVEKTPDGQRTIGLSVGSLMSGRRRPENSVWTDADQQRRSPGDTFFSDIRRYTQDSTKPWPI